MIPKVIHYCWFGGKRKPKLIKDCINSWKYHLSDYEIIEWNEKNSDLTSPFVSEAYKLKKWAFVADFIRLKVLYENGGIYLDTDMMVTKSFDSLLDNECFFGAEDFEFISCGIIGARKNFLFINKCIDFYSDFQFSKEINLGMITIPRIITKIYREIYKYEGDFADTVRFEKLIIYPSIFFYSLPYKESENMKNYKEYMTADSFAVHLWNSSWIEHSEFYYILRKEYIKGLVMVSNNILLGRNTNIKYLKKIASCIKKSLN